MGRPLVPLVAILLCACLLAPAGAVANDGSPAQAGGPGGSLAPTATQQQFDHVEFRITVHRNGSARWTFQYGKSLTNESERQQFREFASEFENGSSPLYEDFRTQARQLASDGKNETGRNMTASGFRKDAAVTGLQDDFGVVEMSFTWTAFGVVDDRRVRVGDVFEGGLYVGPGQRLVVETGDAVDFETVDPSPDDTGGPTLADSDSVTWRGERRFTDEHPQVVLEAEPTTTATTTDGTGPPTTTEPTATDGPTGTGNSTGTAETADGSPAGPTTGGPGGGLSTVPWLAITAVAAVVVVGAVVLLQRVGIAFDGDEGGPDGPGGPGGPGDGAAPGHPVEGEPAIPDEEMLTDEERVLGLLRENGGRMRQVNIVEETGWSKSKVSMLLSEMEADEQVTKLRVGRENIVSLPGHEPGASGSALE